MMLKIGAARSLFLIIMLFFLASSNIADARDLSKISNLLSRVFLAENFATVCERREPGYLDVTGGPLGTIHAYSLHMKNEVVAPLRKLEADLVLKAAALSARYAARQALHDLSDTTGNVIDRRLEVWCALPAKSYVQQIVSEHDKNHASFTRAISTAAGE